LADPHDLASPGERKRAARESDADDLRVYRRGNAGQTLPAVFDEIVFEPWLRSAGRQPKPSRVVYEAYGEYLAL
jgi:hypothetical protein